VKRAAQEGITRGSSLGRLGGSKGGKARAVALTPEVRRGGVARAGAYTDCASFVNPTVTKYGRVRIQARHSGYGLDAAARHDHTLVSFREEQLTN